MSKTTIRVGPRDHGRRMSLAEFEDAEGDLGHRYELGRGVVVVTEVPKPWHFAQVNAIRRQLSGFDLAHPGRVYGIATGSECKILLEDQQSERHPDLAVYMTPPPREGDVWAAWVPEIVVEVVSAGSRDRDYVEKREEYLAFGVLEYWIFDAKRWELLVLRRSRGRWAERVVGAGQTYRTRLLPGFALAVDPVFQAAADEAP